MQPIQTQSDASLMDILLENKIPVASSCGGSGVCAKCIVRIVKGKENLTPEGEYDAFLREKNKIGPEYRISCQTRVQGDIQIDTNYW